MAKFITFHLVLPDHGYLYKTTNYMAPQLKRHMEDRSLQRVAQLARHITRSKGKSKYERLHQIDSTEPVEWRRCTVAASKTFGEVLYEKGEGIAKVTINRPHSLNAFTPKTVEELQVAFADARDDMEIGVVILTGQGSKAFCSGGDVGVRSSNLGHAEREKNDAGVQSSNLGHVDKENKVPRLDVFDLQYQIRRMPKPVIAMVAGYAVGAGLVLQMVSDVTIAADNAVFGQTQLKLGSVDAGFGVSTMVHMVGARRAREICFLARLYDAQEALSMGLVNTVVRLEQLEQETVKWCREIISNSPTVLRVLKAAINATEGKSDQQALAGNVTMIMYASEEAEEGRRAYLEGRLPNFSKFKRLPRALSP